MKNLVLICLAFTLLQACKKYVPEQIQSGEVIFKAKGSLNGSQINMAVDGMNYRAFSSFETDTFNVWSYIGRISTANCEDVTCGPQLICKVRGLENIDEGMLAEPYRYRLIDVIPGDTTELYKITLTPEFTGNLESCDWTVNGNLNFTTSGSNPLILNRDEFDSTFIDVVLNAHFSGGCESILARKVYLPNHGCAVKVTSKVKSGPQHFIFEAITIGQKEFAFEWNFENGTQAFSRSVDYFISNPPTDGIETVETQIQSQTCSATVVTNVLIDSSISECNVNFTDDIETTFRVANPNGAQPDFHTVELEYIDSKGVKFETKFHPQPNWARFDVLDVEDYYDSIVSSKMRSKKISVRLDAELKSGNETIELRNIELVIPVGLGL